jgi:hypothetical protein
VRIEVKTGVARATVQACIDSSVSGIRGAIAYLRAHPQMVQPRLDETSYCGFSFGGIITANELNHYQALGLPKPRAVFLDDPEDGGVAGPGEVALDPSLSGIPRTTRLVCHSGASGALVLNKGGVLHSSCNVVFARLGQIPASNKSLVLTSNDSHGSPPLRAIHGVCAAAGVPGSQTGTFGAPDTYDWGFCWKNFDSLRACALYGTDCQYALGNNPEHRYIGTWSDGVPVTGSKIPELCAHHPDPDAAAAESTQGLAEPPASGQAGKAPRRLRREKAADGDQGHRLGRQRRPVRPGRDRPAIQRSLYAHDPDRKVRPARRMQPPEVIRVGSRRQSVVRSAAGAPPEGLLPRLRARHRQLRSDPDQLHLGQHKAFAVT